MADSSFSNSNEPRRPTKSASSPTTASTTANSFMLLPRQPTATNPSDERGHGTRKRPHYLARLCGEGKRNMQRPASLFHAADAPWRVPSPVRPDSVATRPARMTRTRRRPRRRQFSMGWQATTNLVLLLAGCLLACEMDGSVGVAARATTPTKRHSIQQVATDRDRFLEEEEEEDQDEKNDEENDDNQEEENNEEENEEENDDKQNDDENDDEANNDDVNDDANEDDVNDGDDEMEMEQDDFFEDDLADDVVADNSNPAARAYQDDDFYAYQGDPAPPNLFPLEGRMVVGYLVSSMALTLGASGGIGGGGIIVPVYLLIMGLGARAAMGVGAVTILGGALSSTILNTSRRHPLADRPLIDWDLIMVMQPVVLVGVFLGTFIHQILTEQVLVVLLVVLLSITAHRTLGKAMRMYRAENRYIRHLKSAQMEPPHGTPSRTFTWGDGASEISNPVDDADRWIKEEEKQRILIENPDFVTLRSDLLEQEKFTPTSKIVMIAFIITLLTVLNVAIGGGGYTSPLGVACGSGTFWMLHVVMIMLLITSTWAAQTYLIARNEIKNMVRFDYVQGDIRWNKSAGYLYPIFFMVAGLFAGMFGIGGGIVIVPLLLTLGTHPVVASATSSAMVLLTSVVSSSTYFVFGLILVDFAAVGFFVGLISSFCGQLLMLRVRRARSASGRQFERSSYIAFVIGGVVMVSAVLMTIQYIFSIVEGPDDNVSKLCDVRF